MFKFLKFVLWVCLSVVMAYFLSDIKIGGKTLKENIDSILHSPKGQEIKKEIESIMNTAQPTTGQLIALIELQKSLIAMLERKAA